MSLDISQQKRHRSGERDLTVIPYILNETLTLMENQLLKTSGKKLFDFNVEIRKKIAVESKILNGQNNICRLANLFMKSGFYYRTDGPLRFV